RKGIIIAKISMATVEAVLPEDKFIRVHRPYIVPKPKIKSFTGKTIEIINRGIRIGKVFRNEVMKVLSA
ncbi:MAG TPA: LytTR family transcriptional regulator DNA-binding domain-containing protein, partial [Chitinophagaceae bacterium]|nr:LytTR family transcriptional regulator DNA-binding domain-containing protein [Chitinophagaceae bacterium]